MIIFERVINLKNTTVKEFSEILSKLDTSRAVDRSKTLSGWHSRASYVRDAVLVLRDMRDATIKEAKENYRGGKLQSIIDAANAEYQAAKSLAVDKVEADLADTLESKRKAWNKSNVPPSDEQLRLLQALEIRGADLTRGEVAVTVQALSNSGPALRALRSICKRQGLEIPSFVGTDPDTFEQQMEEAERYAKSHLAELDTPTDDLAYLSRLFWVKPGEGEDVRYFKELDSSILTSADIKDVRTADKKKDIEKSAGRTPGPTTGDKWVKLTYQGNASIYSVAEQFGVTVGDLQRANPGVDVKNLRMGDKINIPSTRLKNWSGLVDAIDPATVEVIDKPIDTIPEGFGEFQDLTAAQE